MRKLTLRIFSVYVETDFMRFGHPEEKKMGIVIITYTRVARCKSLLKLVRRNTEATLSRLTLNIDVMLGVGTIGEVRALELAITYANERNSSIHQSLSFNLTKEKLSTMASKLYAESDLSHSWVLKTTTIMTLEEQSGKLVAALLLNMRLNVQLTKSLALKCWIISSMKRFNYTGVTVLRLNMKWSVFTATRALTVFSNGTK